MILNPIQPHFALSDITTGLYTKGGEYIDYETNTNYIGLYHILPTGAAWSGASPQRKVSKLLIKTSYELSPAALTYNKINGIYSNKYVNPINMQPIITDKDYGKGFIYRFFCQKRNNPFTTIFEIDTDQYSTINSNGWPGINKVIWNDIQIKWYIAGDLSQSFNMATINNSEKDFPGLSKYLTNYLEFHK